MLNWLFIELVNLFLRYEFNNLIPFLRYLELFFFMFLEHCWVFILIIVFYTYVDVITMLLLVLSPRINAI